MTPPVDEVDWLMSAPSLPNPWTINQNISPLSVATAMSGGVSVELIGDPAHPLTTQMGVTMRMANMPDFTLADIFKLLRRRIRMPVDLHFGISVFPFNLYGIDVVQFSICGEPQVILDDYVPNAYERCAVECEPCGS